MEKNKWIKDSDGNWYYVDCDGKMLTGSWFIDGQTYHFDESSGQLITEKDTNSHPASLPNNGKMLDIHAINKEGIAYIANGGDQDWFNEGYAKNGGCGSVVAADITDYYAKTNPNLRALYDYDISNITQEDYEKHMESMLSYVTPTHILDLNIAGVPTSYNLATGVEEYARSKGVYLKAHDLYREHTFDSDV